MFNPILRFLPSVSYFTEKGPGVMQDGNNLVNPHPGRNREDAVPIDDPVTAYLFERIETQPPQAPPRYVPPPRSSGRLSNRRGGVWLPTFARDTSRT